MTISIDHPDDPTENVYVQYGGDQGKLCEANGAASFPSDAYSIDGVYALIKQGANQTATKEQIWAANHRYQMSGAGTWTFPGTLDAWASANTPYPDNTLLVATRYYDATYTAQGDVSSLSFKGRTITTPCP